MEQDQSDWLPAFIRYLELVGAERLATFSPYDFLAPDALRRKQPLSDDMRQRLPALVENGLVEKSRPWPGGALYHLAIHVWRARSQRGLAHETNK